MNGHLDDHAGGTAAGSAAGTAVRAATRGDVPAVQALWRTAGLEPLDEDELAATLEHGPGLLVLAEAPGAGVVGVVLGTFDGRRGWVHRLAVHPGRRRGGLATALVTDLEHRLHERGARRVNLLVLPDNSGALRFWQGRGYLPCPDVLHTKPLL